MKPSLILVLIFITTHAFSQQPDLEIEDKFVNDIKEEQQTPDPEFIEIDETDEAELTNQVDVEFSEDTFEVKKPYEENSTDGALVIDEEPSEFSKEDAKRETYANPTGDPSIKRYSPSVLKNTSGKDIKIYHPLSEKGLTRITRDKEYLYDVEKSEQDKATTVLFSTFEPTDFKSANEDIAGGPYNFNDFYTPEFMFTADYEWQLYNTAIGKFGVKAGSGLMVAQGTGLFESDGTSSDDKLTLFMFPNFVSGIWRLKFWDSQPLIPYVEAGAGYYAMVEFRPEDSKTALGGALVGLGAGGVAFEIGNISRDTAMILDRDYGINGVSLNLEYRLVVGLDSKYDLSYNSISFGFGFEY